MSADSPKSRAGYSANEANFSRVLSELQGVLGHFVRTGRTAHIGRNIMSELVH